MNLSHLKSSLQLWKIKAKPLPTSPEDRRRFVSDALDISYESKGSLRIKRQVMLLMQKLFIDHSQESRVRSGFAFSLYYIVLDTNFYYQEREKALDSFKELYGWFDLDEEVRGLYGRAIENLIRDIPSDIPNSRRLLERIKKLHEEYPHCKMVLKFLSSSTFQLHSHEIRDSKRQIELLEELNGLYKEFPGDQDISLDYGIALHNSARSPYLSEDERLSALDCIEDWQALHKPDDWLIKDVSLWQAKALSNWEDLPRLQQKVAELAVQHVERLHEYSEVREEFSVGAANYLLSLETLEAREQKVVWMMQQLYDRYADDENVADGWSRTLRAIALAENSSPSPTLSEALQILREAAASGPGSSQALFNLVWSLSRLAERTDLDQAERILYGEETRQLTEKHFQKTEVHSAKANAHVQLYTLSLKMGNPDDRELDKLREISRSQPSDLDFRAALADALMEGSSYIGNPKYARSCLEELKTLQSEFPKNEALVEILATAYQIVFRNPVEGIDQGDIHIALESLAKMHPKNQFIARALANVFAAGFFGAIDRKVLRFLYLSDLKDVAKKFPDSREIQEQYASCLLAASVLAKTPWIKRRLLAKAESRNLDQVLDEYPVLAPLLNHARECRTLTPAEVKDLIEENEIS